MPNPNCYGEKAQEETALQYPLECFQEIAANIRRRRGTVSAREESYSKDNSYLSTTRAHANHFCSRLNFCPLNIFYSRNLHPLHRHPPDTHPLAYQSDYFCAQK